MSRLIITIAAIVMVRSVVYKGPGRIVLIRKTSLAINTLGKYREILVRYLMLPQWIPEISPRFFFSWFSLRISCLVETHGNSCLNNTDYVKIFA
ncbi:hypothetical protein GGI43DRAFT_407013 [Trichoderma evansii]